VVRLYSRYLKTWSKQIPVIFLSNVDNFNYFYNEQTAQHAKNIKNYNNYISRYTWHNYTLGDDVYNRHHRIKTLRTVRIS
jgi:hypothetical protein